MTAKAFAARGREKLTLKDDPAILKDLKTIDMLEAATRDDVRDIAARTGNWVQPYANDKDVLTYVDTQFGQPDRIRRMLDDRAARRAASEMAAGKGAGGSDAQAAPDSSHGPLAAAGTSDQAGGQNA